eukprot:TRINITY_DN9632_c0_g1_i1.p1 TRINITY_DN9632_c0_g1~~TRINITY_DN9632_c0_g1_i1.p1  ORF type:complete len:365 (+),score=101.75 TRINITY_DN9632_c0_g1_i1:2-1096(+)
MDEKVELVPRKYFISIQLTEGQVIKCAVVLLLVLAAIGLTIYLSLSLTPKPTFKQIPREGQEIMVCGQLYSIGHNVVLFTDPGGYDAYRVEQRFQPLNESSWEASSSSGKFPDLKQPNRYGMRCYPPPTRPPFSFSEAQLEEIRGGGWNISLLRELVDLFVVHYDVTGVSKRCFEVLQDSRDLSVHFMIDVDGTIYQTLDVKERAWHAGIANARSIGIEIANIGAYPPNGTNPFASWYKIENGETVLVVPPDSRIRTANWRGGPVRPHPVAGVIQGELLEQYDLTREQYEGLGKLVSALLKLFPKMKAQFPRDEAGGVINRVLNDSEFDSFQGILGHYHVSKAKTDPGPAFQWQLLMDTINKYK